MRQDKKRNASLGSRWLAVMAMALAVLVAYGSFSALAQGKKVLLDLNTAPQKELEALKGVGPATAKKIVAGRPYKSVDDLAKAGIPKGTIEGIRPLVTVGQAASQPPAKAVPSAPAGAIPVPAPSAARKEATQSAKVAVGKLVNINTASKEQLEALPEIGPVKAQAIIDGRPYRKVEDIMKVKGIKEGTYSKIKDFITVQ